LQLRIFPGCGKNLTRPAGFKQVRKAVKVTNPEAIVQKQFEAYNQHDVETFAGTFSEDIELFELPDTVAMLKGRAALTQFYTDRFREHPTLRAELSEQLVSDNTVIYKEKLYGLPQQPVVEIVAIYQIQDNLIRRIWFIRS
jgi:hypothetical protein